MTAIEELDSAQIAPSPGWDKKTRDAIFEFLQTIHDGYVPKSETTDDVATGDQHFFLTIDNPDYNPINGLDPILVLDLNRLRATK